MYIFIIDINVASILSPCIYHMHQVQELVNQEAFAKYDRMLLMTSLDQMVDVMYCPRPACQYPVSVDKESNFGNCPSCRYVFCVLCQLVYHGLSPCKIKSGNSPFISFLLSSLCFNVAGFPIITCYVWQYLVYFFFYYLILKHLPINYVHCNDFTVVVLILVSQMDCKNLGMSIPMLMMQQRSYWRNDMANKPYKQLCQNVSQKSGWTSSPRPVLAVELIFRSAQISFTTKQSILLA